MKHGLLLSLLLLSGCTWFSGGDPVPNDSYTAIWELDSHAALSACDGTIPVNYHISQCLKNGIPTDLSGCSGLIKLPEQVKSPAGTKVEDIKNYLNESIGQRTYNCAEGEEKNLILSTVNCLDSRYIKQTENGVEDCNPYIIDLENLLTSENKILSAVFDSERQIVNYINSKNLVVPGFSKGKIFDQSTGLFYKLDPVTEYTTLVLDSVFNSKPIKDWTKDCALFQDGTFDCNLSPVLTSTNRYNILYNNADKIFQGPNREIMGLAVSKKGYKYYFRSYEDFSVNEIPQLENKNVVKVFDQFICYEENGIVCLKMVLNETVPGYLEFVPYYYGTNVLDVMVQWFCIKDETGGLSCKGEAQNPFARYLEANNFPEFYKISNLNVKLFFNNRILTNDNKMYLYCSGFFKEIYIKK